MLISGVIERSLQAWFNTKTLLERRIDDTNEDGHQRRQQLTQLLLYGRARMFTTFE